jgi:3-oxoacyl-[acyl-carrier-protein] synthase-3
VIVPRLGHFAQDGRKVQMFAIKKTCETLNAVRAEFEDPDRRFHFVGHQANLRVLETVCRRCEIPEDRHHFNVEWYGNTGCASAASVISMEWDKWTDLDDIGVIGVGSGLTWAGYRVRFTS